MDMSDIQPALAEFTKTATERIAASEQTVKGLKAQIDELEQKAARRGGEDLDAGARGDYDLAALLQKSDAFQALLAKNATRCSIILPPSVLHTKTVITGTTGAGAAAVNAQRLVDFALPALRRLTIRDLLPVIGTQAGSVEYVSETSFTNSAAAVAEAAAKPESTIGLELRNAKIATIAHWVHASTQVLSDAPTLRTYLDGRLRYGLRLAEENQLLNGGGTGADLLGMVAQATAFVAPITVTSPTLIDTIRLAIGQLENANYGANGVIVHPNDWTTIELLKDADGNYLRAFPTDAGARRLWGVPVVVTSAMTAGSFLAGDFAQAAVLIDREAPRLDIAYEDQDDFVKNLCKLRVEERVGLAVQLPGALVLGEFE